MGFSGPVKLGFSFAHFVHQDWRFRMMDHWIEQDRIQELRIAVNMIFEVRLLHRFFRRKRIKGSQEFIQDTNRNTQLLPCLLTLEAVTR